MAKRKNKKGWLFFGAGKKKRTKAQKKQRSQAIKTTTWIFTFLVLAVGVAVGFIFFDRYVKNELKDPTQKLQLELVDLPGWLGKELEAEIVSNAVSGIYDIDSDAIAQTVGENLAEVAWLDDVNIRLGTESIIVNAKYRKPIGLIRAVGRKYYVDSDMVLLDYVPIENLAIVEITGVPSQVLTWRMIGTQWARDDLAAALELLKLIAEMDTELTNIPPLLPEIKSIDVSNYNGRRSSRQSHIVFYANDGTEIRWGAEKGSWHKYLEARDEEKLTLLYNTYEQMGTLALKSSHKATFIDLTRPQSLSLPIDRY